MPSTIRRSRCVAGAIGLLVALLGAASPAAAQETAFDWRSDWGTESGFALDIDTEGYDFPTAMAFVPHPGGAPDDPLYFVTELKGKVKVVTNDRSVYTFAEGFTAVQAPEQLPSGEGHHGAVGLCLDPQHGYVFVTYVYHDTTKTDVLRNNIVRFTTQPETFGVDAIATTTFADVFARERSYNSHQIGSCRAADGLLYVSVGDGLQAEKSQYLDSTLGKVLRMTLDSEPVASNPFYEDDGVRKASDYVWAYGFRNPMGLHVQQGRVFVAENGPNVDRFLEVEEGRNYLWEASDWSIGTNASVVFAPAVSPVHLDFYPQDDAGFPAFPPEYRDRFYVALVGRTETRGPGLVGERSIAMLDYNFEQRRMNSPPRHLLKYRGNDHQAIVGMAFGPDGLYFAPLFPNAEGRTPVFRVSYAPEREHPHVLGRAENPALLISQSRCLGCHRFEGRGGLAGPPLERPGLQTRLTQRLHSEAYVAAVRQMIEAESDPTQTPAQRAVLDAEGPERVRTWLKYQILQPGFDKGGSAMPPLGLSEPEADLIADYLLAAPPEETSWKAQLKKTLIAWVPASRHWHTALAFLVGLLVPAIVTRRRRRRLATNPAP